MRKLRRGCSTEGSSALLGCDGKELHHSGSSGRIVLDWTAGKHFTHPPFHALIGQPCSEGGRSPHPIAWTFAGVDCYFLLAREDWAIFYEAKFLGGDWVHTILGSRTNLREGSRVGG